MDLVWLRLCRAEFIRGFLLQVVNSTSTPRPPVHFRGFSFFLKPPGCATIGGIARWIMNYFKNAPVWQELQSKFSYSASMCRKVFPFAFNFSRSAPAPCARMV